MARRLWGDIDLYNDGVVPTGPVAIGTHRHSQGSHTLTVEIVGANAKAQEAYMFGLDQVILTKAKN